MHVTKWNVGSVEEPQAGHVLGHRLELRTVLNNLEKWRRDTTAYVVTGVYTKSYIRLVFFRIFKCDQIDRKWREEKEREREEI
jgi:hypothetical protein